MTHACLPPLPRGGPEWRAWWITYRASTRDPALTNGLDAAQPAPPPPNAHDAARERWHELRKRYSRLLGAGPRPWEPPPPLTPAELGQLVVTLQRPECRPLLREVLLDLLADDMIDLAIAAQEGVRRGA